MERQYLEDDYLYEDEDAMSCLRELRSKIDYAKKNGNIEKALFLYMDYVRCDVFRLYCKNAIAILSEFMDLLDRHPEYYDHRINVMIGYKWVLAGIDGYLWYSLDDLADFYRLYHYLCLKYGYSLRTYYQFLWTFLRDHKSLQEKFGLSAEEAHKLYKLEIKDRLSDSDSIEDDGEVSYYLTVDNDPEKAISIIQPYFDGIKKGREIPHHSYFLFAKYYFKHKLLEPMITNAKQSLKLYDRDFPDYRTYISIRSYLFLFLSFRYPQKSIRIFKKILPYAPESQSLFVRMIFYRSAYKLFVQLERIGYNELYLDLPSKLSETRLTGNGKYTVAELKELFYTKAKYLADKFDERDGEPSHNDNLNEIPVLNECHYGKAMHQKSTPAKRRF